MLYLRRISTEGGWKLQAASRRSKDVTRLRRAQILLASVQGMPVPEIAGLYHCSEAHIRWLIHEFNARGLPALSRKCAGGRPATFTEEQGAMIVKLALMPPGMTGLPFSR